LDRWFYSLIIELLFRASVKGKLGLACFNQLPGLLTRLYHQFCFLICFEYSPSFIYINLYLYLLSFFFLLLIKRQNFRLCFCLGLISSSPFIGPTVALVGFQPFRSPLPCVDDARKLSGKKKRREKRRVAAASFSYGGATPVSAELA